MLAIIGVNFKNGLSVTGWIALNCTLFCRKTYYRANDDIGGMVSILAIHSFGRVVHRHERDALLAHPSTCTAINKAASELADREGRARRQAASRRTVSSGQLRTVRINADPFADTQALDRRESMVELTAEYTDTDTASVAGNPRSSRDPEERTTPRLSDSHFPATPVDLDFRSHLSTPTPSLNGHQMQEREYIAYPIISISSMSTYSLQSSDSS